MKKINQILPRFIAIILPLFMLTGSVYNQAPGKFNYQAVLRDATGVAMTNHAADIQISILQGSASGSLVFTETHNVTTSALGMINLEIGSVNPTGFAGINWSSGPYFLKIKVDGIEMGTTQLLSVPFALYAQTAGNANNTGVTGNETVFNDWDKDASNDFSGDYDDLSNKPTIPAPVSGSEYAFNSWDKDASNDFSGNYDDLSGKPNIPAPVTGTESVFNAWDKNATDDFSGNYDDLSGKPTIPAPVSGSESVFNAWDKNASDDFSGSYNDLTNKPTTIPDNSVTSSKIVDGAIQNVDIANNAIESNKITDGSITSVDIADEPAIKQSANIIWKEFTSSCAVLHSINITAPATGRVLVIATGSLCLQKSSTVTEASWGLDLHTEANACPGVTPAADSRSAARGYYPSSWSFSSSMGIPFCFQEVFSVTKGQVYNFYLNGRATGFSSAWAFHPTIVAIFIPSLM